MRTLKKKIEAAKTASSGPNSSPSPTGELQQGGISKIARARLQKDFAEYEAIPGCIFEQIDANDYTKYKLILSPLEGYYEGGKWSFLFECPRDYPNNPPKVSCITQIYHPNIDLDGHVCLSTLRVDKDWSPVSTLSHVVAGILSLFLEPNPEDPLNIEAGELMKKDLNEFVRTVTEQE
ncbi:NEDD8-conjugating enzyme Ubc12, putative, partial [Entamoeba invadens IP1]